MFSVASAASARAVDGVVDRRKGADPFAGRPPVVGHPTVFRLQVPLTCPKSKAGVPMS